jgi:hypothetical protein
MAQTAPPSANQPLTPPDERFWQRYSPHSEFPLSGAASFGLHLLVFGLLALLAWFGAMLFGHASRSLPVEAVRLETGGGGGNPHGRGDGPGVGKAPEEAGSAEEAPDNPTPNETVKRPDLKLDAGARTPLKFDREATRYIQQTDSDSARAFERLKDVTSKIRVPDGKAAGHGRGGTGSGGGSGDGTGTGTGNGRGEGAGKLTQREKRMLRWSMLFNTNSAPDYLSQLQGLGAILAIPVREDASGIDYRLIRDLSARPAKLLNEDVKQIQRIYWIDDKPQSVMDVMAVLQVPLARPPSHFVAFMPDELEAQLLKLELAYFEKKHKGRGEDDILSTKFRINRTARGYVPEVIAQKVK